MPKSVHGFGPVTLPFRHRRVPEDPLLRRDISSRYPSLIGKNRPCNTSDDASDLDVVSRTIAGSDSDLAFFLYLDSGTSNVGWTETGRLIHSIVIRNSKSGET